MSGIVFSQFFNVGLVMTWPVWCWSAGMDDVEVLTGDRYGGARCGRKGRLCNNRLKKEWILVHESFKVHAAVCNKFIIAGIVYKFGRLGGDCKG